MTFVKVKTPFGEIIIIKTTPDEKMHLKDTINVVSSVAKMLVGKNIPRLPLKK